MSIVGLRQAMQAVCKFLPVLCGYAASAITIRGTLIVKWPVIIGRLAQYVLMLYISPFRNIKYILYIQF